jgi:L-alanine-DL-glutamate epimerase-like enolase superfamily enzyme
MMSFYMTNKQIPTIDDLLPKPIAPQPPVPHGMRTWTMYRHEDESGVSGTGIVAQGVVFANGMATIQWLVGPDPGDTQVKSDWEKFLDTHVRSHPTNKTIITFGDRQQLVFEPEEPQ